MKITYRLIYFFIFCIIPLNLYSGTIEINFFSSETGYRIEPDAVNLSVGYNNSASISLSKTNLNSYTASIVEGYYNLTAYKNGYGFIQCAINVNSGNSVYSLFMDPIIKTPELNPARISSMLKPDKALLLGFIVDDLTGNPAANVSITDENNNTIAISNALGYFEAYLPALCETRTFHNLVFSAPGYKTRRYDNFELTPKTDFIFTVRLKRGNGNESEQKITEDNCTDCRQQSIINDAAVTGFVVPLNIKVGRNCTGTNCTSVEVYSLQTYCKYVLPGEIYACWGNLSGGMNSLQACAVAVRTYGTYYVYNPISSSYDICDNTYCQFFGSVQSTNTNTAVDNTLAYILTNTSGVVRSEYSAENNNKGCGNGYSGTGASWPCIYDPVCSGYSPNGHGRGLCQWGTVRWATGRIVTTGSPCSQGSAHSYGTKTWQEILNHYYNVSPSNWQVTLGSYGTINTSSASPQISNPCATITINSNVTANNSASYMIGASIAPAGTTNWISDPTNDVKRTFSSGTANYQRSFKILCNTAPGTYDMLTALWYDKNNNNIIDGSDFVVSSKLTSNAITISPIGITPISSEIPEKFALLPNYPNPFNPVTKIKFDIPLSHLPLQGGDKEGVKLIIYDLLGREVVTLVNEQLQPGSYSVDWDATGYASGLYFYSLVTDEFTDTKRMVLIK